MIQITQKQTKRLQSPTLCPTHHQMMKSLKVKFHKFKAKERLVIYTWAIYYVKYDGYNVEPVLSFFLRTYFFQAEEAQVISFGERST